MCKCAQHMQLCTLKSTCNKILLDKLDKFNLTKIHCGWIDKNFKILMTTTIVKMKMMTKMMMVTADVRWEEVFL